jgi:hypothetical protein
MSKHHLEIQAEETGMAVANPNVPAVVSFADMAGEGLEDAENRGLSRPLFKILQSLSKELESSEPEYVPGAVKGAWFDTTTKESFKEIVFVPCRSFTNYLEWKADKLGEFIHNHGTDASIMREVEYDKAAKGYLTKKGTKIVPTDYWYGLVIAVVGMDGVERETLRPAMLEFRNKGLKTSAEWMRHARGISLRHSNGSYFTAPLFYMTYRLTIASDRNESGSWHFAKFDRAGKIEDCANAQVLLQEARKVSAATKVLANAKRVVSTAEIDSRDEPDLRDDIPF